MDAYDIVRAEAMAGVGSGQRRGVCDGSIWYAIGTTISKKRKGPLIAISVSVIGIVLLS